MRSDSFTSAIYSLLSLIGVLIEAGRRDEREGEVGLMRIPENSESSVVGRNAFAASSGAMPVLRNRAAVAGFSPGSRQDLMPPVARRLLTYFLPLTLIGLSACNRSQPTSADNQPAKVTSSAASDEANSHAKVHSGADSIDGEPSESNSAERGADRLDMNPSRSSEPRKTDVNAKKVDDSFFTGNWTTRRLIALSPGGPAIIDLSVSLDGQNLKEASEAVTAQLADEIFEGLETPVQWDALLEQPLVKSGWLGNLIAEEDQISQLIGMYDTERDDVVTLDELGAFLSRGLARNAPIQISDIGQAPGANVSLSPWGGADSNQDYSLDAQEIEDLPKAVTQFDYNGDEIVTAQEVNQANPSPADASISQMSLLETNSLVFTENDNPAEIERAPQDPSALDRMRRELRRISSVVLGHYTFLEGVPRDEWNHWSAARWNELDANQDGLLNRAELEELLALAPDQHLYIRFPDLKHYQGQFAAESFEDRSTPPNSFSQKAMSPESGTKALWMATDDGGRITLNGCIAEIQILDVFGGQGPKLLRDRLEAALKEPQLEAFFRSQLQLQDEAFELLDADGDESLSDEEFAAVWRWLSARQGTRLLLRWMTAATPWFQLLDVDGNQRLTTVELQRAAQRLHSLDANGDSALTPDELPLLVKLELKREDNRLRAGPFGLGSESDDDPGADDDWFSAMDTNRDGFIANSEFLGDRDDFGNLDADKDGFIARSEVY